MKKFLSFFLVFIMLFSLSSVFAYNPLNGRFKIAQDLQESSGETPQPTQQPSTQSGTQSDSNTQQATSTNGDLIYGENNFIVQDSDKAGGMSIILPSAVSHDSDKGQSGFWQKILTEYRGLIVIASGFATLTFVFLFIVNFIKLAKDADNPTSRANAMKSIIISGVAIAGCGSVTMIVGLFYNLLL